MPPTSFPVKLWKVVNNCPNDLMRWSNDGTEVLVNEQRFEDLIDYYPSFLRQPTLSSLHRLFAVYEFRTEDRRDRQKTGWMRYSHPYFVRGEPHLLELFVLSHQTKRYNARRVRCDINDRELQQKTGRRSAEDFRRQFATAVDSDDDLQPICSSSLFQFTLAPGLDLDTSVSECSPPMISSQRHPQREEYYYSSADCSTIIDTESPDKVPIYDSEVSVCPQDVPPSNFETWMSHMNENEEWFGLNDQPIAVPVCGNFTEKDAVDYPALSCATLQQMQHYNDD